MNHPSPGNNQNSPQGDDDQINVTSISHDQGNQSSLIKRKEGTRSARHEKGVQNEETGVREENSNRSSSNSNNRVNEANDGINFEIAPGQIRIPIDEQVSCFFLFFFYSKIDK